MDFKISSFVSVCLSQFRIRGDAISREDKDAYYDQNYPNENAQVQYLIGHEWALNYRG